jgi:2-C-methyl-D-erythritol 4-phosphate cytidylyltransferase
MNNLHAALIVPAAGSGQRLGHDLPKALVPINGRALLVHTLEAAAAANVFSQTVVAVPAEHRAAFEKVIQDLDCSGLGAFSLVQGGATRRASVSCALAALNPGVELVCVHDAARPLVAAEGFLEVLTAARDRGAATLAHRPADSVRRDSAGAHVEGRTEAEDRSKLWMVETPQAFRREVLVEAHRRADLDHIDAGDDCSLVERYGAEVSVVPSAGGNVKVTTAADLALVEAMVKLR